MTVSIRRAALCTAAIATALAAVPASTQQQAEPPIARYEMDAGTASGMGGMSAAGGGAVNPLDMLRGGGAASHQLVLRLGSSQSASGSPSADHFMPSGAGLGNSVPLVTPVNQPSTYEAGPESMPQGQLPKGKLYIFWGCGEHAGPGQPVVIDFAKLARGEMPPGLFANAANLPQDWRVMPGNSKTYGDWPNGKDAKALPANSSLLGNHRVAGNYSPEIAFALARDFMPALQPTSSPLSSGATALRWNGIPEATGYYAWAMGAQDLAQGQPNEMVWWTSASSQQFGGSIGDWLSPAAVQKLVAEKTVLPPGQTSCTIPAEAKEKGGEFMMLNLFAYGPESNFAYPPRPDDPKVAWKPDWTARVRFRSSATTILGMPDMGAMGSFGDGAEDGGQSAQQPGTPPPSGKPRCSSGLKGKAMKAAGLCE